ncbi:MAG: ABC transporter permease [Candidatus Eisenbacteria bacterium]|uniref:ABC transporter permease n=1 Tax=Eiseniibacteriota bacterium TaxID=2212470 RepID=A0A948S1Y4_UNCEI|nr:ABC transporter permease [Candidatus Eisenbacteria bacterium]MBU1951220.1 ABC transporter permease [Candidatus Eisenbacteria bacterium]MBU2692359.1 ABC transporter permease [Candidatus Eisenbacteria bacterium]
MIHRDFVTIAMGNLWRMKLRSALTISGVVIGIGALVSMLSFAFGAQKNVSDQFQSLGLFHTLHVMPVPEEESKEADSSAAAAGNPTPIIDDAALTQIEQLPGVTLVYPEDIFDARIEWGEKRLSIMAQSMPAAFVEKPGMLKMLAGNFFSSDDVHEVVLDKRLVERLGAEPDSIIGDSILIKVTGKKMIIREFAVDLLRDLKASEPLQDAARQVADIVLEGLGASEVRLVVSGVADFQGRFGFRLHDIMIPSGVAGGLDRMSFSNPMELLSMMTAPGRQGYSLAVVTLAPDTDHTVIRDAIDDMGFRTFSFIEQFEEMKDQFLLFDLMMGIVGFIAIVVASLGIMNTMIMSILERTREIGILKSLGAEDGQIRWLFLMESGIIGFLGGIGGVILGWIVSRIASLVIQRIMVSRGMPEVEMFYLPWLLVIASIAFGILVSLLAGMYPARRAVRVDPVQALRND